MYSVIFNIVVLVVIAFMTVKLSFRLFIVRLIHDLVLNLLNSLFFAAFQRFRSLFFCKQNG